MNFFVADNSGGKMGKCINIFGSGNCKKINLGSFVILSVVKFYNQHKLKKRNVYIGLIVLLTRWSGRKDGLWIRFIGNRVLIFNKEFKFLGTRIYGAVAEEIKWMKNESTGKRVSQKVVTYSNCLI